MVLFYHKKTYCASGIDLKSKPVFELVEKKA